MTSVPVETLVSRTKIVFLAIFQKLFSRFSESTFRSLPASFSGVHRPESLCATFQPYSALASPQYPKRQLWANAWQSLRRLLSRAPPRSADAAGPSGAARTCVWV